MPYCPIAFDKIMITISTNENNDLYIDSSGNLAVTQDIYAVSDVCKNKVLTTLGEPQYNQTEGIPYFETIFTDTPLIDLFQASVIDAIETTDNVERVKSFEYTDNNGIFNYVTTIQTSYGELELNG